MIQKTDFYVLLGIVITGFIALIYLQNKGKSETPESKVVIVHQYDSLPQLANNIIKPYVTVQPGQLPDNVINVLSDTAVINALGDKMGILVQIMERYFEVRTQEVLAYTPDSLHLVNTVDTLTENSIISRQTMVQCFKPITTITETIQAPERNKVYLGLNFEAGVTGMNNIGPEITLATKKGWQYQVGWNGYKAIQGDPYNFSISGARLISFKRKKRTP